MSGFNNPIIGGGGALVYPSIHSPNYQPGGPGWSINKDGTAELSGLILDDALELHYSPSGGLNNLVYSNSVNGGTDRYGNVYLAAEVTYSKYPNGLYIARQSAAGGVAWWFASSEAGPWTQFASEIMTYSPQPILAMFPSFGFMSQVGGLGHFTEVWVGPSGDTSGADDTQLITALIGGGSPLTLHLLPGTFYLNATVTLGLGQYLTGAGMSATTIKLVAAAGAVPAVKLFSGTGPSISQFAGVRDLTIDGTSAASGATGLQAGDILQVGLYDVTCQNFGAGGTSAGFVFVNQVAHTEQLKGRIYSAFNTRGVVFNVAGGDTSFDRLDLEIYLDAAQVAGGYGAGVQFIGGALSADMVKLGIHGNMAYGTSSAGIILVLGTNSVLSGRLDMGVELGGVVSAFVPQTIFFNAGSSLNCAGILDFSVGQPFVGANPGTGQLTFSGPISGDANLQSTSYYGSTAFVITANGQTIPVLGSVTRIGAAAAFTGLILAAGRFDGQTLFILNQSASAQTFAAAGSNVTTGASPAIPASAGMSLVWNSALANWHVCGTG